MKIVLKATRLKGATRFRAQAVTEYTPPAEEASGQLTLIFDSPVEINICGKTKLALLRVAAHLLKILGNEKLAKLAAFITNDD